MRVHSLNILVTLIALPVLFLVSVPTARAQGRLVAESELAPFERLPSTYRFDLLSGKNKEPIGDKQKKEIRLMAMYYVYYMTIPERQQPDPKTGNIAVEDRRRRFGEINLYYILKPENKQNNKEFRQLYVQELVKCFRTVFAKNEVGEPKLDTTSLVHTGLLLPMAAQMEDPAMLAMLIDLVRDPGKPLPIFGSTAVSIGGTPLGQNALLTSSLLAPGRTYGKYDIVKMFAFKALQVYFKHSPPRLNPFASEKERMELADKLRPIADYILNPPMTLRSSAEMDAFRYIRQEAIKALAKVSFPMVPEAPHPTMRTVGDVLVPVAYTHMRVLAGTSDGLFPPPSMSEKCEAAIGLCNIDGDAKVEESLPSRYNEELAVVLLGQFAVDFLQQFQKDRGIIEAKPTLPAKMPWRIYSDRLKKAFDDAPNQFTPGSKAQANMNEIKAAVSPLFDEIRLRYEVKGNIGQVITTVNSIPRPIPTVYTKTSYQIQLK